MKRPTTASLKKVTAENLAALGAERLAQILIASAETRPDLKRRLRMELAAEQGSEHLELEIDKRLASLAKAKSKVSWRKRASFVADLDALRKLIVDRLAALEPAAALDRLWPFMALARPLSARVFDRDGTMAAVFLHAAGDIGRLITEPARIERLVETLSEQPARWAAWLPAVIEQAPPSLAVSALDVIRARPSSAGTAPIVRLLADAAGDVDAFIATFPAQTLTQPGAAAEAARRLLAAGRLEEAGRLLEAASPLEPKTRNFIIGRPKPPEPDFAWETAWIDYLDQAGRAAEAQDVRWRSFERSLSVERAKAFVRRLPDFDDIEAENRAFAHAAAHADFERGLAFLMDWPALPEASRMILARPDDIRLSPDEAELWAGRLIARQPRAAQVLLRKAADVAARGRNHKLSQRLNREADAIAV